MDEYRQAVGALPASLAGPLAQLAAETARRVHEVRLRAGCPVWLNVGGALRPAAETPGCPGALTALRPSRAQMEQALYALCGGSIHTHQAELAQGYLTLPGGHRAGVGGRYFLHPEEGVVLQEVQSIDLRVARDCQGELPEAVRGLLQGRFTGVLVAGEPDSGKTTLLRGMAAYLAGLGRAVAVVDEREELWPAQTAAARPPVDLIAGLPKARAVQMALRTLAPQVILLDELGDLDEVRGLEQGFFGGVGCIATLHAASVEEALCRPQAAYMRRRGMIRAVVQLAGRQAPGLVSGVHRI